ncbi:hypothetical protein QCA50_006663 [Cerrena zonata]|uniref:Vacuolar fusion protein MON1 n=1 Tax=Cerrena zonata TaxID=2478898 RepID=A0AAW0GFN4_9APHY
MSRTPRTPRSRTPSRVGTPVPGGAPPRLVPPQLRSAPSVSSLRVFSHGTTSAMQTPLSGSPPSRMEGLSSPPMNSERAEGILIQEPEVEVETIDGERGTVSGHMESSASDEDTKRNLREHLRRTLTEQEGSGETIRRRTPHRGRSVEMDELSLSLTEPYVPRQYFVLTDAGKPVFISRQQDEDSDNFTSMIGLMQALISVFLDDGDKIRCINAGKMRITFLLRSPLYYACVSSWGEPESVTRFHLEYLHLQILSVVSAEQLRRMFERRNNFDLRRLLSGAEPFLYSLLSRLEWDMAMATSSLFCLKLDPNLRKAVANALVPTAKIKDVLYMVLVAQGRVVTLVRPRKHSIHPSDLHVLVNTVYAPSILNSSASASWLPICLPKFNASAFVNAYVMFLRKTSDELKPSVSVSSRTSSEPTSTSGSRAPSIVVTDHGSPPMSPPSPPSPTAEVGLICVSGAADFEAVRSWCNTVSEKLEKDGLMNAMSDAIIKGKTTYSVSNLGIPGLRHFLYKSRSHVQITMPEFEDPYDDLNERRRLVTLYQTLHDAIHAKSGQGSTLKLQYIRTERESVMGWITQPFELYMALSPLIPKSAAVNAANAISRWVQKEEKRLFLRDAPVF